ncbi:phage tail protein [Lacrimispora brassicae]
MEQYDGSVLIDTKINADGAEKGTRNLKSEFEKIVSSAQAAGNKVKDVFSKSMKEVGQSSPGVGSGYDPKAMEMVFGKSAANIKNYAQAVQQYGQQAGMVMNKMSVDSQQAASSLRSTSNAGKQTGGALKEVSSGGKIASEALKSTAAAGQTSMVSLKDSVLWGMNTVKNTLISAIMNIPTIIRSGLSKIPAIAQAALKGMATVGKMAFQSLGNLAVKAAGQMKNLAKNVMKSAGEITKSLLGLRKGTQKTGKSFSMLGMLFRTLVFSMFYRAIRGITSAIRGGIENLARYSSEVNQTMSQLKSSLTMLKNSFAVAFAPIIEFVAPALTKLISKMVELNNWIAQTMAALAGKDTFTKAIAVQEDYAASLAATKKATKDAAKETKKATFAFDTLIQAQGKNSDKEEYTGPSPDQMFKTVEVAENVQKAADKIRELLNSEDFAGIGELLGQKINGAIARISSLIDWNNVGGRITEIVTRFVSLFNAMVSTINWDSLGRMLGKGINTIVNTLYLLLNGIDWVKLGEAFAKGLNGLIYEVDWEKFGATIGSFVQAKIDLIYGFVTTADWPAIGKAMADGVMGLINRIDWARFGETLGKTLSGMISSIHNFIQTIDWTGLGKKISETLNNFFANIDWADFGQTLSDFALGLLETLRTALKETDWEAIGQDLGEFLVNVDWWKVFTSVVDVVIRIALAVVKAAWGMLKVIGKALWEGITEGIAEFSEDPGAWIKKHIVDPFMKWIKDLFGIHSPSTVMAEIGKYLMEGLIQGLENSMGNLVRPLTNLSEKIKNGFQSAFDGVKSIAANAVNSIIDTLNKLKFDVPDWVPGIGGKSFGFNIKHVAVSGNGFSASRTPVNYAAYADHIPRLATGTVVPPRAGNFMAMLGDNNKDYEVVSPLETMKQAFKEAIEEMGGIGGGTVQADLIVDGTKFGQLVYKYNNKETDRVGVRLVTSGV